MKVRKIAADAALGILLSFVLLGLFELVFWAAGMDAATRKSVSAGFDETEELFFPDPNVEGGWNSNIFGGERQERPIPPKGEARRVLLFGGSNTRSFQHGRLDQHLDKRAGEGAFEVINLGRSGFGSGRVRHIFEQALEHLEPDVVVIYSGHNELTEASFELDLEANWEGDWMQSLASLALETRTVRLLAEALEDAQTQASDDDESDEESTGRTWSSEYKKLQHIDYRETQRFYEVYEQNLRAMCEAARARDVETVLCTVIYNRFAAPFTSTYDRDFDSGAADEVDGLRRRAHKQLPELFEHLVPPEGADNLRLHYFDWKRPKKGKAIDPAHTEGVVMDRLEGVLPSKGPLAKQDPLWDPPKGWNPKIPVFYHALGELHALREAEGEKAELKKARALLRKALDTCPDHPHVLFELGLVEYALGARMEEVAERLEASADFDRAPRKGNRITNGIVRKVASEVDGVRLLDADADFARHTPLGLPAWEWMTDHCHLNVGARVYVMRGLAELLTTKP